MLSRKIVLSEQKKPISKSFTYGRLDCQFDISWGQDSKGIDLFNNLLIFCVRGFNIILRMEGTYDSSSWWSFRVTLEYAYPLPDHSPKRSIFSKYPSDMLLSLSESQYHIRFEARDENINFYIKNPNNDVGWVFIGSFQTPLVNGDWDAVWNGSLAPVLDRESYDEELLTGGI